MILTADYASTILTAIRNVDHQIKILVYVATFNIYKRTDGANLIFSELKHARTRGVHIKALLDYPRKHKPNYYANRFTARRFLDYAFETRFLRRQGSLHAKLFLFDRHTAVFGSHNLCTHSVTNHADLSFLTSNDQDLSFLHSYFDQFWTISTPAKGVA